MGNPNFSVPSLDALVNSGHEVVAVVTSSDRPQGRGRAISSMPVANAAAKMGLRLIRTSLLTDPKLHSELSTIGADLYVVVAFKVLSESILQLPKLGSVNLHPSLLPKYRGAAPIQWALMNGENLTGISTFILSKKLDSGNLLMKMPLVIFPEDDYGSISKRASYLGSRLMLRSVDLLASKKVFGQSQDESKASKAPKIHKVDCQINWMRPNVHVRNQIRALSPSPGAVTKLCGRKFKFFKVSLSYSEFGKPAEVISITKSSFMVRCGAGSIKIEELQPEGKKRITARQFLASARLTVGDSFE